MADGGWRISDNCSGIIADVSPVIQHQLQSQQLFPANSTDKPALRQRRGTRALSSSNQLMTTATSSVASWMFDAPPPRPGSLFSGDITLMMRPSRATSYVRGVTGAATGNFRGTDTGFPKLNEGPVVMDRTTN